MRHEMNVVCMKAAASVEAMFSCANNAALILDAMIMASIIFALLSLRLYILSLISLISLISLLIRFICCCRKDCTSVFA